jgi:V8-like Glu-specific endopeptidase
MVLVAAGGVATAQPAPIPEVRVGLDERSGVRTPDWALRDVGVLYQTVVQAPEGTPWTRVSLAGTRLAGDGVAEGARVRLTSLADGAQQILSPETLPQWGFTSAMFNGDAVLVELISHGEMAGSELVIDGMIVGEPVDGGFDSRSICGTVDDRLPSNDPRISRLVTVGCTAWLIRDTNTMFLSAGHCTVSSTSLVQFNVPPSTSTGTIVAPPPEHQYALDLVSNQGTNGGLGLDWRYFGVFANPNTGLTPSQAQNAGGFKLATGVVAWDGEDIRITGYGTTSTGVPREWNQYQKTHTGPWDGFTGTTLRYRPDTTGGNSGSPIILDGTSVSMGIHTNGGCTSTGGANQGAAAWTPLLVQALAAPRGIAASGWTPPAAVVNGDVFLIGDGANNFGRTASDNRFARISTPGRRFQGLAYDVTRQEFLAINADGQLAVIDPDSGEPTELGVVTGTTAMITGLACDDEGAIYAISQSNGQLHSIDRTTLAATPIGAPSALTIGALEYDLGRRVLFGVADGQTGGSRLVRIDPMTGEVQVRGSLGATIADVNGLAINWATGEAFAVDATTDVLYRVHLGTGAATASGATNAIFGNAFGMAYRNTPGGCGDVDFNNDGIFPDNQDAIDFFNLFAAGECADCDSIDFNRDTIVPDMQDIVTFVRVFGGGAC